VDIGTHLSYPLHVCAQSRAAYLLLLLLLSSSSWFYTKLMTNVQKCVLGRYNVPAVARRGFLSFTVETKACNKM